MNKHKILEKVGVAALATCMTAGIMIPTFAAVDDTNPQSGTNVGTLTVTKQITTNQAGKFPNINDANFKLQAVKAWDNANEDTTKNGTAIEAKNMPMPEAVTTDHHKVTVDGTTADITVGDFMAAADTSKKESDADKLKVRKTPVQIKFSKAGYYVYKLTEEETNKVSGMTYDTHSYFISFYVTNATDKDGNTIDGVKVHNITAYRNESGKEDYQPDLTDIANTTDNKGTAAQDNTRENLAKVGINPDSTPDQLDSSSFWNDYTSHDVVITKNVTGNLGDKTKQFQFTIKLAGLQPGKEYSMNEDSDTNVTPSATIVSGAENGIITADKEGKATVVVKMKDDQATVLKALPVGATYDVTEAASDHKASVKITSDEEKAVIANASKANDADNKALDTGAETVDAADGTVDVAFTNDRTLSTITGVAGMAVPAALLLIAGAALVMRRRKRTSGAEL